VPLVILTARNSELDRVLAFELGASDYITKPFSPRELVLRIGKQLHESESPPDRNRVIALPDVLVDPERHMVKVRDKAVDLTPIEFKLLTILAERRGRVQTRDSLLQEACGYDKSTCSRTVDTHMRRLRKKLGAAAKYVQTVRGFGYRLADLEG
jgi:two-component system phosphate regulon response regulator PhoB